VVAVVVSCGARAIAAVILRLGLGLGLGLHLGLFGGLVEVLARMVSLGAANDVLALDLVQGGLVVRRVGR
jgi:hypothetical protein